MSENKATTVSDNIPAAEKEKLTGDSTCGLTDSRADSGFISSGNLQFSGEIYSGEIIEEPEESNPRYYSDSGVVDVDSEEKSSKGMHLYSGLSMPSDCSLSEKISKLDLSLNNVNEPTKVETPVVENNTESKDDDSWNIYFEQDEDGDTHLHTAIFHGFAEVALALIRAAPSPRLLDTPNDDCETPLHLAVQTGQYPVARWLIIAGARPCPRDSQGNSPLHLAARLGDLNSIKAITDPVNPKHREIMALRASPIPYEKPLLNQWNYLGQTCVHTAARHGHLEVLKYLAACGADMNAREGLEGVTALHYAVQNRDVRMVQYLLTECRTLNPEVTTYGGRNAWQWSMFVPDDIRKFLEMRGLDSPYSSEEEDSSEDEDDVEMKFDSPVYRFTPNLVDASA